MTQDLGVQSVSVCWGDRRERWCLIWALEDRKGFQRWEKKENPTCLGETRVVDRGSVAHRPVLCLL